jgi:organic radical activating enzyme
MVSSARWPGSCSVSKTATASARVIEIFPSIQGEGLYVGLPHLFVRFWNCNMNCHYCDTDFRGPYSDYPAQQLLDEIQTQIRTAGPFHAISLTGGEPLLWTKYLQQVLPELKAQKQTIYLETNGTLTQALREIQPWVDIVAMDIKPPSATADRAYWTEHAEFLRTAIESGKEIFVKVVVTAQTVDSEIEQAVALVAGIHPAIPFILQPVTPWGGVKEKPSTEQIEQWRVVAKKQLNDVRIIPQVHRILGVR